MRHIAIFAATFAALLTLAAPARADMADCEQVPDWNLKISGCTAVIGSGQWQGKKLAWAYYNRGIAYARLGEYRRAIEDYDQSLRLDPGNALAYRNRTIALDYLNRSGETYRQPGSGSIPKGPSSGLDRETVRSAQRMLAQLDLYEGEIDGIVGPITRRAVRQFQEEWGYPVTGAIDQRLLGQLDIVAKIAAAIAEEEKGGGSEPPAPRKTGELEIQSTGTGFYVDSKGSILTNAHVVEGCSALTIGDEISADLVAEAGEVDLALLRAPANPTNGVARFSSRPARLNADVTVIGFPFHGLLGGLNVTRGAVSSTSGIRGDDDYFQMTAAVQPGNSGGPVVNIFGAVIGVVVSKLDAIKVAKVTGDIPQNINFAIRGELAKLFLTKHNVGFEIEMSQTKLEPATLAEDAGKYTVLISCWGG